VLAQVVHVDVAIGLHPVFVGFDGERAHEAQAAPRLPRFVSGADLVAATPALFFGEGFPFDANHDSYEE
jgi:hypothetical protein